MNAPPLLDLRSANSLWASVTVETLARSGVSHAIISPGSRSTPLAIAFARHPGVTAIPVLDERSAGFFALGMAKASGNPVVLLCTSGTAGANYYPAVVEASESGVPLLVITADRPPELRASASGQTIDQQRLFGPYANFFHELALPELNVERFRYLRQMLVHAVARTSNPQVGPVHLNAPFRDPLAPLPDGGLAEAFAATQDWQRFFSALSPVGSDGAQRAPEPLLAQLAAACKGVSRGVVVVGPNQPVRERPFVDGVRALAQRLQWPVLADGLAPVRNHASDVPHLVTTYDTLLRNPAVARHLEPEFVLCIGNWPTSKVLRSWLEAADPAIWLITRRADNRDALHGRTRQLGADLSEIAAALPAPAKDATYAATWSSYEARVRAEIARRLDETQDMVEPKAGWLLARHLPEETPVFVSNSMPIRDVEYFWPAGNRRLRLWCNRGANGIDGTLSSALGVAHVLNRPSVLLTGDLALLHDTNGFLLAARSRASLTVVLINNSGGGIFEHLPVAQFDPPFEEFFATPQNADFARLCSAYGAEHIVVRDWQQFREAISNLPARGVRVLEVRTDRKHDAALRKRWFAETSAQVGVST